jgi:arylsulfatase A-like enzyme
MPRRYLEMYDPAAVRLPASFLERHPFDNGALDIRDELLAARPRQEAEIRRHIAEYYAMISHLDAEIARILQALDRAGHGEDTIVILAGDNGLALGKHGLMGKQSCYEHSVRVPLVVRGPGIARGERRDAFVYLLDIYRSLFDMIGLENPASVEGVSFAPLLGAGSAATARESVFYAYAELHRAVRDRRHKLIEYVVRGKRHTQLFDLVDDPEERTNVAMLPGQSATVRRLRRELAAWSEEWGDRDTEWGKRFWSGIGAAEEGWR